MELEMKPDIERDLLMTISQLLKWIMILIIMISVVNLHCLIY
jgi:hypothetical protein